MDGEVESEGVGGGGEDGDAEREGKARTGRHGGQGEERDEFEVEDV